jgi:hypothetical protein
MGAVLAVCAGDTLKLPQGVPPQVAVQSTPRLLVSLETLAAIVAWEPATSVAGGAEDMVTMMGVTAMMDAVADAETAGFVVDLAVMVTVLTDDVPGGAL